MVDSNLQIAMNQQVRNKNNDLGSDFLGKNAPESFKFPLQRNFAQKKLSNFANLQ